MNRVPISLCALIAAILSFPFGASFAQQQGVIRGAVTDRSGNPVSGIKVVARNKAFSREISSNSEGKYQIELPGGTYEVSAGTDCNQSMFLEKEVRVAAGDAISLDVKLNIIYGVVAPNVSMWQLIANPDVYHNRFVRVHGFLHLKFEDSGLYATKDDADYLIGKNALWVTYSGEGLKLEPNNPKLKLSRNELEYFDGKYVLLEGIFNKGNCGHMGAFAGEIKDVTRVVELKRWYDGKKELK